MTTSACPFYCFEVLAASYSQQQHPDLQTIVDSYEQWQEEQCLPGGPHEEPSAPYETGTQTQEQSQQLSQNSGQLPMPLITHLRGNATPSSLSSISTPSSTSVNSSSTNATTAISIDLPLSTESQISLTESYPMFVTWNTLSRSGNKSLRGCIGTFEPLPLEEGLGTYALTSALEDTRFSPIQPHSLPSLSNAITLLADFEECDGAMDWMLGKHGIRISFTSRGRRYGATYLPDVAVEQGWTQEETLESLMRKAGYETSSRRYTRASTRPWEDIRDFRVVRYTGLKATATYSEWKQWQGWAKQKQPDLWS